MQMPEKTGWVSDRDEKRGAAWIRHSEDDGDVSARRTRGGRCAADWTRETSSDNVQQEEAQDKDTTRKTPRR